MAHAFFDLGRLEQAHRQAVDSIALLKPSRVRHLAMENALAAAALARSAHLDEGCHLARQAVVHAARTVSFRSQHRIAIMFAEFHPYSDTRLVRDLRDFAHVTFESLALTT
ncbi:hypothetical protein [Phytomonospora endophytica]|uniref:MalT-like TPR region domain-containing protein n=1 Tax=Phytomonospora endophytica TaxID=714109 RepID=A0A841FW24_9ACTN|nr:hypothetical protein [Phytomonospora endophytica]MBB6039994.1 hypothetical protein [Phytomonospora endophytica]GIG71543.1 hypothetical protein Pen01_78380 [Phytomonospora endophytica]